MELRQLRSFVAVAEELHFGRAAQRLHISQPPLSQQIRHLEEELGCTLFARTSRKVSLTHEGVYFLEEAREILSRAEAAAETVRRMVRGETGRLALGFVGPVAHSRMPEAVKLFREQNPDISLGLHEMSTLRQLDALNAGRDIDLGFIRHFGQDLSGLTSRLFIREPYVLAVPEGHRLEHAGPVGLEELDGEPLIMFPRHFQPDLYDTLLGRFQEAGVCLRIVQEVSTKKTTGALIAAGMGLSLLPRSISRVRPCGVALVPFEDRILPNIDIVTVWPEDKANPVRDRFLETLKDFREIDPGLGPDATRGQRPGYCMRGGSSGDTE